MKTILKIFLLGSILLSGLALAKTFEDVGLIENVNLVRQTMKVNDTVYQVPAELRLRGSDQPAILSLKEGMTIRFHGTESDISGERQIKNITVLALPKGSDQ